MKFQNRDHTIEYTLHTWWQIIIGDFVTSLIRIDNFSEAFHDICETSGNHVVNLTSIHALIHGFELMHKFVG